MARYVYSNKEHNMQLAMIITRRNKTVKEWSRIKIRQRAAVYCTIECKQTIGVYILKSPMANIKSTGNNGIGKMCKVMQAMYIHNTHRHSVTKAKI